MNASLKRKICVSLCSCMFVAGVWVPSVIHAAPAKTKTATTTETAPSFVERINRILSEWHSRDNQQTTVKELIPTKPDETARPSESAAPVKKTAILKNVYDFDWQGTPLTQTLYAISKISGKRVVINGQLSGTVYTSLQSVTYDQALNYLAKTFNFNWMEDGGAILISTSDLMRQDRVFNVKYANKEKVKEEIKSLGIDEKNIYVNDEYGSVSVTGTPYQLARVQRRLDNIDKPVNQCLIIVQLIEVSHGKDLNLGLKYSLPTYSHTADEKENSMAGKFVDKLTFSASMEASKAMSKGKVIARPMIMSLNGQEATIYMGDSVPVLTATSTTASTSVTVEYKDIGTTLKVTPIINIYDNEISMKIDTNVSNISKWITQGTISAPQVSSRRATTTAHLKSGQSFVIGGLMSANELNNLSGIPGLMNLPILGNLFKYHNVSKTYAEVFIMVTPYIVSDNIDPKSLLREVKE